MYICICNYCTYPRNELRRPSVSVVTSFKRGQVCNLSNECSKTKYCSHCSVDVFLTKRYFYENGFTLLSIQNRTVEDFSCANIP